MSIQKVKLIVILIIISIFLVGCSDDIDYHGDYPELYSVAISSLLGSSGYAFSERKFDSEIEIIEEDNHGRVLFSYYENMIMSTYSLLICQKTDEKYSYFYPDFNFISSSDNNFSDEDIEELKKDNDWDMEIDDAKCVSVEIVRRKSEGPLKYDDTKWLYGKTLGDDAYMHESSIEFLIADDYNRSIYLGYGRGTQTQFLVMLFNPDGSYDDENGTMMLSDPNNYQDDLKKFKESNDWNKPL